MSSIQDLLSHFDKKDRTLYIDIDEISDQVLRLSYGHSVIYCKHDYEPDEDCAILGMLEQVEAPRAWGTGVDDFVHYDNRLNIDYKRLVIAKELIHILDPECYLTNTVTKVGELFESLSAPSPIKEAGAHCFHDYNTAVILAVGLFLPLSLREELIGPYESGSLTVAEIAADAKIPAAYVSSVMQPWWPKFFQAVIEKFEHGIENLDDDGEPAV